MKLIQYISTTYVREELYNPDNWDLINPKSPPEFISSGGPFCHKVELEGFEPSSKRGTNMLSTCVVSDWFSKMARPGRPNHPLSLRVSHRRPGAVSTIPDIPAPPDRLVSEKGQSGDVSSPQLLQG